MLIRPIFDYLKHIFSHNTGVYSSVADPFNFDLDPFHGKTAPDPDPALDPT